MESKLVPCKCGGEPKSFLNYNISDQKKDFGLKCNLCGFTIIDTVYSTRPPTKKDWTRVERAWNRRSADDHK